MLHPVSCRMFSRLSSSSSRRSSAPRMPAAARFSPWIRSFYETALLSLDLSSSGHALGATSPRRARPPPPRGLARLALAVVGGGRDLVALQRDGRAADWANALPNATRVIYLNDRVVLQIRVSRSFTYSVALSTPPPSQTRTTAQQSPPQCQISAGKGSCRPPATIYCISLTDGAGRALLHRDVPRGPTCRGRPLRRRQRPSPAPSLCCSETALYEI